MNYSIVKIQKISFKEKEELSNGRWIARYMLSEDETYCVCLEVVIDHEPSAEDVSNLVSSYIIDIKKEKISNVVLYDISNNVNVIEVNGISTWLDKATRVGLRNSLTVEKNAEHVNTTLYLNGIALVMPVDTALGILDAIELYAIDCYRTTESHKAAIAAATTIAEVEEYDYTAGYPTHPQFTV